MKKAKIYKPSKTAMQSGYRKSKNWILEFDTLDTKISSKFSREYERSYQMQNDFKAYGCNT